MPADPRPTDPRTATPTRTPIRRSVVVGVLTALVYGVTLVLVVSVEWWVDAMRIDDGTFTDATDPYPVARLLALPGSLLVEPYAVGGRSSLDFMAADLSVVAVGQALVLGLIVGLVSLQRSHHREDAS